MSTSSDLRLVQSWHDHFDGRPKASAGMKRALKMVTGTPWILRPAEVVARRRCITRALVERDGPAEDCGARFRRSQQHSERCWARFDLLCAGEEGPVEARAQEGQPAPPDPAVPKIISTSAAAQTGGVDTDVMESEDIEPAVSSRAHATAAPIRPFATRGDETVEQEGPESKRQRIVAGLLVCSLLTPCRRDSCRRDSCELRCHTRDRRQTSL